MRVPPDSLRAETLRGVALEFVTREGTDYGHSDWTMEEKVDQVLAQIASGEVVIFYDHVTETVNLVTNEQLVSMPRDDET